MHPFQNSSLPPPELCLVQECLLFNVPSLLLGCKEVAVMRTSRKRDLGSKCFQYRLSTDLPGFQLLTSLISEAPGTLTHKPFWSSSALIRLLIALSHRRHLGSQLSPKCDPSAHLSTS